MLPMPPVVRSDFQMWLTLHHVADASCVDEMLPVRANSILNSMLDKKQRVYYFNTVTKKSQWTLPEEIAKEQEAQEAAWAPTEATQGKVEIEI